MNKVINSHQINGSHILKGTNRKLLLQSIYLGEKLRSEGRAVLPSVEPFIVSIRRRISMYICVERSKKEYNYYGEYVKDSGESALYYSREIGRSRIYRQSYPECGYKGLRLLTYKKRENAQKECDYINSITDSNYEVVEI